MIDVAMVGFVGSDNKDNVPERGSSGQPPIVERNGRGRYVGNGSTINLLEELRVRMNGFLLEVADHPVCEFW